MSDNGPEFLSHTFRDALMQRGIEHTFSVAHELVHNGAIERTIKTVTQMPVVRRSLAAAALPARLQSGLLPFVIVCIYLIASRMQLLIIVSFRMRPYITHIHVCITCYRLVCFFIAKYYRPRRRYLPSTRL